MTEGVAQACGVGTIEQVSGWLNFLGASLDRAPQQGRVETAARGGKKIPATNLPQTKEVTA